MHIAFKFHYLHDNGLFVRLLQEVRVRSELALSVYRVNHDHVIEVSGEQDELEKVAESVSEFMPQSLFLDRYTIEEIETRQETHEPIDSSRNFQIPCCPECQRTVALNLNPFTECCVCGFDGTTISFEDLCVFVGIETESTEELFTQLAERLIENKKITLPTYNGIRHFSLLGAEGSEENGVLVCDPTEISGSWVITQGELDALMMIEKPSVRLKPKLKFRAEYNLKHTFYPVFFADDRITAALSIALQRKGIAAVFCDRIPSLRVASALGEYAIIHSGRDMLPWTHPMVLDHPSCCTFEGYYAYGGSHGLSLEVEAVPRVEACVRFTARGDPSAFSKAIVFEPAHAALRSIALEHDLQGPSLCGVYLSRSHRSQICSFSPKIGYTSMISFGEDSLDQPGTMLASIAQMDEAGARLIANYKTAYPELVERIEQTYWAPSDDASMFSRLWAMAAAFIGLNNVGSRMSACEQLEATSLEFNGKSGPRIDYKVIKSENGYRIDPRLAIRSAISFKLAGVDEYLLSFGFIDSLADFIAQQAELADANIAIEGVALSGSLFENRQLLMRTYNALSSNYPIYRNRRLSMDGANVAVGALMLGSE